MYEWILPSVWEILAFHQSTVAECSSAKAEQQWRVSVAAIEQLLLNTLADASPDATQGLVLAAPAPVLSNFNLTQSLQTVTFTNQPFNPLALMPFEMPTDVTVANQCAASELVLPLLRQDPLVREQFCLIFTTKFRLVLVLAQDNHGNKKFSFSFEPEVVEQTWRSLGARVILSNPDLFTKLEQSVQKYAPVTPDYRIVMKFSQLLLQELPEEAPEGQSDAVHKTENPQSPIPNPQSPIPDVELLQAFAHEVRTPLSTIRTITRLLLKRRDLPANVIKRLEMIDHECTEQIDRMELLFRAAELETSRAVKCTSTQLTAMSLDQVLQQSIPRWQQAATRRNLNLDVVLPQQLPTVVSNPNMLDRALTGLIENFTRSLPSGSHIQVKVIPAGSQLKLQLLTKLQSQGETHATTAQCYPPIRKALGHLLTFQPETGTIGLNFAATKHLFQAIGGKLTVKERPLSGEILTIYLPLEVNHQPIGVTT